MRILVGTIVRQHPEVLRAHLELVQAQRLDNVEIDLVYIDDNDDEESRRILQRAARTLAAGPRDGAEYGVGEFTHGWNIAAFHRMAREKQRLLDVAVAQRYDAVWLVDSDLFCAPGTLQSLVDTGAPIVSAVFWTRWTPSERPLPQVWVQHPYGFEGAGYVGDELLRRLRARELRRVRGLGACTLIRLDALKAGVGFYPLVDGLPNDGMWQGEDRHFCVRAERLHVPMFADGWPEVWHCYRPSDREHIADEVKRLRELERPKPEIGDEVSLAIEPLEEPQLIGHVEHVRGRLGALKLVPELGNELSTMAVRDARFVRINLGDGRGRLVRLRLLDARAPAS